MLARSLTGIILLSWVSLGAAQESPLAPVKTDHPRDTMRTFMQAMNTYRTGMLDGDLSKIRFLDKAVRTLDLSQTAAINRLEKGHTAAILLKEVIDRVIIIDYDKIPDFSDTAPQPRWRLKGTEITITRITEGERAGEYLFSANTVERAHEFYDVVYELPYLPGSGMGALYQKTFLDRYLPPWAKDSNLGLHNWQWIGIVLAIFIGFILKWLVELTIKIFERFAAKSQSLWDDQLIKAIEPPVGLIAATGFWFLAIRVLQFDGLAYDALTVMTQIVFSGALIWLFLRLSHVLTEYLAALTQSNDFPLDDQIVPLVRRALRLTVVVIGSLIAIQNLGINVVSLLAGLGLGGLAFALAAKDTAANLFGSIMILWDGPFKVGDWIVSNGIEGTVEEIGFRSTRIRTFYNSEVSVPNSQLANVNIDNMGRREFRRIKAVFGLTYDTPPAKLEAFLEGVKNIIKANPHTRKDNYHVVFTEYGPASLNVLLYCFLKVPDWARELVERQNIFLEIWRLADTLNVEFAFPTQTLHVESLPGQENAARHAEAVDQIKQAAAQFGPGGALSQPAGQGVFTPPFQEGY